VQKIADLIPKLSPQLVSNSEITTSQKAPSLPTIQPHGERGLKTTLATTEQALGRSMAEADPKATMVGVKALLPPEVQSSLKSNYSKTGELTGYTLTGAHGERAIEAARRTLKLSLKAISPREAVDLLSELKALTRPAQGDTTDLAVTLRAYAKRLSEYPADVVRHVLNTHDSPWWPAWAELSERLEIHSYRRKLMLQALEMKKG